MAVTRYAFALGRPGPKRATSKPRGSEFSERQATWLPLLIGKSLQQLFRNLDCVERGALKELAAADPEPQAVVQCTVLADAAHGAVVFFRQVKRQRVFALG